jgi:Family of unknown function (DUF6153)
MGVSLQTGASVDSASTLEKYRRKELSRVSASPFASIHRPPSLRYLILALVAVPLIVLGILAMHFLASGSLATGSLGGTSLGESTSSHAMVESGHTHPGSSEPAPAAPADDCDGMCAAGHNMPGHSLMAMVCVLALMIYVLLFVVPVTWTRWGSSGALPRSIAALLATLAPRSPPSLSMLSLSRR